MDADVRKILDDIDEFLVTQPHQKAEALWAVLTALRGPDSTGTEMKHATTSVIRTAAFPRVAPLERVPAAFNHFDRDGDAEFRRNMAYVAVNPERMNAFHFRSHVWQAFEALDLTWDTPNGGKK